ncbi:hypothetical protein LCL61_28755 [Amycolatopsis coloradensis]|uniref:Uncharacterized protein n=1 Tax=Amycolatopsis coloradensis TaxID=76021 RepID=A0ACD5BJC9_9PSEU
MPALRAAIVGAGLIGMDLFHRIREVDDIEVAMIIGRSRTRRLGQLGEQGYAVSYRGLVEELDDGADFDVIFDATDARTHPGHWERARTTRSLMVDLTPSHVGVPVVPVVNIDHVRHSMNISMVSCAGQASIPILAKLVAHLAPGYVEVTATAASSSFGPGTRRNANEFIESTRDAILELTGSPSAKFMASVSPARPAPDFRLSVSLADCGRQVPDADLESLVQSVQDGVRRYSPGYSARLTCNTPEVVTVDVAVQAVAATLPSHAGNLEIINGAAVQVARLHGRSSGQRQGQPGALMTA